MNDNEQGMKVYKRVIDSARMGDTKIGSKHHQFDGQFQEWCQGKSDEEIEAALTGTPKKNKKPKTIKKELSKQESQEAIQKLKSITAHSKPVAITQTKESREADKDRRLKEKFEQMKRQKFIDTLKPAVCRCAHIKSVGNGL